MAQPQRVLERRAPQIVDAVAQARRLVGVGLLLDGKRRRRRAVEEQQLRDLDLDLVALAQRASDTSAPTAERLWAMEQVHPFFVPELNAMFASPRFVALVPAGWEPTLNDEHDASRWVPAPVNPDGGIDDAALARWLWPGQRRTIIEACRTVLATSGAPGAGAAPTAEMLRIEGLVLNAARGQRSG